jgi:hypothetical protein
MIFKVFGGGEREKKIRVNRKKLSHREQKELLSLSSLSLSSESLWALVWFSEDF